MRKQKLDEIAVITHKRMGDLCPQEGWALGELPLLKCQNLA